MFYDMSKISDIWPQVASIDIAVKEVYRHAFGEPLVHECILSYESDDAVSFGITCLNDDCTGRGFDLYGKVANVIAHGEVSAKGTIRCEGNEARDHRHRCPCVLDYEISVGYIEKDM